MQPLVLNRYEWPLKAGIVHSSGTNMISYREMLSNDEVKAVHHGQNLLVLGRIEQHFSSCYLREVANLLLEHACLRD